MASSNVWLRGALRRIRANSPRYKPQLWEHLPFALRRKAVQWFKTRTDEGWLDRPQVIRLSEFGLSMEVVPRNYYIDGFLYVFGIYEISGTRLAQALLRPGMTVLDVGANSGYYSLLCSRIVGPRGKVHAFEPVPRIRARLLLNLELNRIGNVQVHPEVVSDRSGIADFYVSHYARNEGISSTQRGVGRDTRPLAVPAVTLDAFVERESLGRADFVKIDVEGAEAAVLDGARGLLSRADAPAIMFESYEVKTIAPRLERLGYEVRCLHYSLRNGLEFYGLAEPFEHVFRGYEGVNYLALKDGRPSDFNELVRRSRSLISRSLRLIGALS